VAATKPKEQLDAEFSSLYRDHLRDVYSYAYYRVGNHHDAEDLTTQTFLQAYRHFERAQRESGGRPLRPWLIRIAHNLAANHFRDRSRKPQTNIDDTTVLSALHTTEDLVEGRDELKRVLGQKKVIWLKEGVADDDLTFKGPLPGGYFTVITTGGHIDEYARFADEDTILLAEVSEAQKATDEIAAITYERLRVNEEILKKATDQDGKPFEIVRVPVPEKLFETMKAGDGVFDYIQGLTFEDGTVIDPDEVIDVVLPASYLNYIITNGLVIYQTYWKPGRPDSMKVNDEKAKAILERTFSPQRRVVGVNAEAVNLGGGGIHCISQQQPQKVTGR